MAHLRRQNKIYHIIYSVNGLRKSFSTKTEKKHIAEGLLKQFEAQNTLQLPFEIIKPQPRILLSQALKNYQSTQENENTKSIYGYAARKFIRLFSDRDVTLYNKDDFIDFFTRLRKENLSQATVANYSRHLYILFNYLVKEKYLKENPVTLVRPIVGTVKPITLSEYDVICMDFFKRGMIKQFDFIRLTFLCALRIGEAMNLHGEDFDLKNKLLSIRNSKGKRTDTIPLLDDIINHVVQMDLPPGKIFDYHHRQSFTSTWKRANHRFDFNNTIHSLRKARGSQLADAGVEPLFLQKFMRHRDFRTTIRYYLKIDIDNMRKGINSKITSHFLTSF